MFHYCIYGREPRYANSLESSGKALRIHMSDDMRVVLDKYYPDEFIYIQRKNDQEFKSKKRTYWLIGERNNPRPMPDVDIYKKHVNSYKRKISNSSSVTPKFMSKFWAQNESSKSDKISYAFHKLQRKMKSRLVITGVRGQYLLAVIFVAIIAYHIISQLNMTISVR